MYVHVIWFCPPGIFSINHIGTPYMSNFSRVFPQHSQSSRVRDCASRQCTPVTCRPASKGLVNACFETHNVPSHCTIPYTQVPPDDPRPSLQNILPAPETCTPLHNMQNSGPRYGGLDHSCFVCLLYVHALWRWRTSRETLVTP